MINKYSSVPLYSQLKELVIGKIESGEYREYSKIPSEQEFCEAYDVSRPTVRQAIIELTNSGYLYKEKGRGTFVAGKKSRIDVKNYSGFTHSMLDSAVPGEFNIIGISTVSSEEHPVLKEVFNLHGSAEFAEIKYITECSSEILSINISYIPLSLFPTIIEDIETKKPSYDILKSKYAYIPSRSKSALEVGYSTAAESGLLKLQPGQPVIYINNVLYSKSGQVVEYIVCKYKADKVTLIFENSK